jgi:hypothetical protein
VKLLLIVGFVGFALGVLLTALYFSLAAFFEVNAKALNQRAVNERGFNAIQRVVEQRTPTPEDAPDKEKAKAG